MAAGRQRPSLVEVGHPVDVAQDARIVDVEALLMVRPVRWAHLFAGYRSLVLDAKGSLDGSDFVNADVTLSGFMFGGGFEF